MSFTGRPAVSVFQCKVIASALRLYASTGMKVNRAYTPTNMLRTASALTGKTFKRGQYEEAAVALTELPRRRRRAGRGHQRISQTGEGLRPLPKWLIFSG
jgi:hypothetical protein